MLPRKKRGEGAGVPLYPVVRSLGIVAGATPALCEAAVLGVINNTFDEAQELFAHDGIDISSKRLRTISRVFSQAALAERQKRMESFLCGELEETPPDMSGKRIAITMDGGRIRTRKTKNGCLKKGAKRKGFHTDWKEPKVFTIYELDDNGRKKRNGFITCDGTIDGPEPFINLLAAELVRAGVCSASEVIIIADGALWIWDHINELCRLAGIAPEKITTILDFYHATEHLKKISELLYKSQTKQTLFFNKMRKLLKQRSPKVFMAALEEAVQKNETNDLIREYNYFSKKIEAINYRKFSQNKLPIGSGVIESTIRRVVNLRLKGAGMFWLKENAEAFLHLRCQFKAGNWNSFYAKTIEKLSSSG